MIDVAPGSARGDDRKSVAGFVALLVTLCIVTAVALRIPTTKVVKTACGTRTVTLLGDSITDQARGVMASALSDYELDVEATPGRKIAEQLDVARKVADRRPDRVIINLGSNDVLLDERSEITIPALHQMAAFSRKGFRCRMPR